MVFHRYNFLHLTGVKINAKDGSSGQKLDILESMMMLKQSITMIGDFTDRGPKLYAEKIAGNVCGCIGFVKDNNI